MFGQKILISLPSLILWFKKDYIRVLKFSKNSKSKSRDPNIINLEENVESKTGLKVKIHSKKNNSGSVLFEYRDNDQLNHLLMIIKANY